MQSTAAYLAFPPGMISGISPERFVPGFLAKRLPQTGAVKFLVALGIEGGVSGVQSAIQQAAQNAIAKYLYAPDNSLFDEVLSNALSNGLVAMLLKGGETGFKAALPGHPNGGVKAAETGAAQVSVADVSKTAQESKLRQHAQETFRKYVAQATANGPIEHLYVPTRELFGHIEAQGIDPHVLIEQLRGVSQGNPNVALVVGDDFKIPTATYAARIAGSELDPLFLKYARFTPANTAAKQSADFKARGEELLKEMQKNAEPARIDKPPRRTVKGAENDAEPPVASGRRSAPQGRRRRAPSGELKSMPKPAAATGRRSAPRVTPETIPKPPMPTSRRNARETMPKPAEAIGGRSAPEKPHNDPKTAGANKQSRHGVKAMAKDTKIVRAKRKALRPVNKLRRAAED
ncbi:hypothetical protein ACCC98_24360 [Rhizobium pisi]|uniref:hypothetical protein n=1 Tax=Rhizobium pisi TaxID=574561 RepID=UPI0039AECC07